MLGPMAKGAITLFIECRRCGHKGQREVEFLPLPAGARWRCSVCQNREAGSIKVWHTGGSSAARIISFPRGNPRNR
jgi:hypothetical protein